MVRFSARGARVYHLLALPAMGALFGAHLAFTRNSLVAPQLSTWVLFLYCLLLLTSLCLVDYERVRAASQRFEHAWRPLVDRCFLLILAVALASAFSYGAVLVPLVRALRQVDLQCATHASVPVPIPTGSSAPDGCQSLATLVLTVLSHTVPLVVALVDMLCIDRPFVLRNAVVDHLCCALVCALFSCWSVAGYLLTNQWPYALDTLGSDAAALWWVLVVLHVGLQLVAAACYQACRALLKRSAASSSHDQHHFTDQILASVSNEYLTASVTIDDAVGRAYHDMSAGVGARALTVARTDDFEIQTFHVDYQPPALRPNVGGSNAPLSSPTDPLSLLGGAADDEPAVRASALSSLGSRATAARAHSLSE